MLGRLLLSVLLCFTVFTVKSQEVIKGKKDSIITSRKINPEVIKKDSIINSKKTTPLRIGKDSTALGTKKTDTIKTKYVNPGKIAGRRAMLRSAMLPGLGQIRNGLTFYRALKVAGLYTGATLLTLSYIDNTKNYHIFLDELKYRAAHNNIPADNSPYKQYSNAGLITAKDTFRRNREVVIFSFVGLYLLNVVEAYIDARLKYFDVGDATVKFTPTLINSSNSMYGFNASPGFKITLAL